MGVVFRQSIKTTIVIFLGAMLGALIIWLQTNYIGKQELGFVRQLTSYAVVGTQILLMGVQNTISVYIHKYADSKSKRGVLLAVSLLLPIVIIPISSIFYFAFKIDFIHVFFQPHDYPLITRYFAWLPVFTVLMMYQVILEQFLISQVVVALSSFVREVGLRAGNIIIILLFGFNAISFDTFIGATVLMYLIPLIVYLFISAKTSGFALSLNFSAFSKEDIKDVIQFTWYHSLLSVSITLMGSLDTMMVGKLDKSGLISVAIYANAMFFISILQMPYKAMYNATFPVMAAAFKDNDMPKVQDLFNRSSLNIIIGATIMAILILCNIGNAIALMPAGYEMIKPLVAILVLGTFIDMAFGMNGQILSISQFYRFNFYGSIILVAVIVLLNFLLIPRIGGLGAACSNSVGLILFNIAKYIFVRKRLDLQPFSRNTPLVLVAGLPAFAVGYFLPNFFNNIHHLYMGTFLDVAIRSGCIITIYLLMLLWLKPSPDLTQYIATIKKNKRLF